jgi:hypothetical protein
MAETTRSIDAGSAPERRLRWIILVAALCIIVLRILCPAIFERVDAIAVALLFLAVVPWISVYVSKLSIPGVIEAELRKLEQQVQETREDVASASQMAIRSQDMFLMSVPAEGLSENRDPSIHELAELGRQYVEARRQMLPGVKRTISLDALFRSMVSSARALGGNLQEPIDWLRSNDAGQQLAAIAYSYAHPGVAEISALLDVVEGSSEAFVQFWGLRGVLSALEAGGRVSPRDLHRLEELMKSVRTGTDRHVMLATIIQIVRSKLLA